MTPQQQQTIATHKAARAAQWATYAAAYRSWHETTTRTSLGTALHLASVRYERRAS